MDYEYETKKPVQSVRWLQAELPPPKKEIREKKLSVNIQKFLARKEEEEKQKKLEADRKMQDLLALRSQDKKSNKRVQSMLKRTKSANKSVLEDAVDNINTAVTVAGPLQPDEDDYGYVSQDASALYDKLINKYNSMPTEETTLQKALKKNPKDISSTKDRVRAALQREEDEKLLPKKRKRKSDTGNSVDSEGEISEKETSAMNDISDNKKKILKFKIPKRNSQLPPPPDFETLLKIADQKKNEPIVIQKIIEDKPERPMTKKEKEEYMREQERKMRREAIVTSNSNKIPKLNDNRVPTSSNSTSSSNSEIKKLEKLKPATLTDKKTTLSTIKPSGVNSKSASDKSKSLPPKPVPTDRVKTTENVKPKVLSSKTTLLKKAKEHFLTEQRKRLSVNAFIKKQENEKYKSSGENLAKLLDKSKKTTEKKSINSTIPVKQSLPKDKIREFPSRDTVKEFPPKDVVRQFPPKDVVRQFPPMDVRGKPPPKPVRRQVIESDDEYDSEMDDFIDDSEDKTDVSKHISEIFGYDRRRYANVDDDDECMESNFSQLQKEEFISTKYGILEDLADVRRTKLMKSRKKRP